MNSKLILTTLTALTLTISTSLSAEEIRVTDDNAPFLYESRAEIKAPDHVLAEYISEDYKYADDEFTKHDLFQQIKPVLTKRIKKASETNSVYLTVGFNLENYNFDKGAFATGFSEDTIIPFDNGYAIFFANGSKIQYLPVAMKRARSLASDLRSSRAASMKIFGKIVDVKEGRVSYRSNKVINVKITKVEVKLKSGVTVGELQL